MGNALWNDLPVIVKSLSEDQRVRVVVLAARGPHFSVGLDLKELGGVLSGPTGDAGAQAPSMAARASASRSTILRLQAAITAVADCPKPVVAAVHGYCIGGGVDLIAACDIRLASVDAVFSVREAKVAIVADLGSLQRLPRIIGAGHVAELAFTGKDIDAARAREIGLVNDVLPDAESTLEAARALAAEIAANSPVAVQGTKAVLAANDGHTVSEGLAYVATWNAGMLASDDLVEAMTAFVEKRPPDFTGR
jgi:enoyl-CoA hydratase